MLGMVKAAGSSLAIVIVGTELSLVIEFLITLAGSVALAANGFLRREQRPWSTAE